MFHLNIEHLSKIQGTPMNKLNKSGYVNWEELITSNMLQLEAIVNILERKNIADRDEILEEVKKLKAEMEQRIQQNKNRN